MGLDTVELVMGIEDKFGIDIPDEDAEKMQTMKDAHAYIVSQIQSRKKFACPTQHAFGALRKALIVVGNFPREAIRPDRATDGFLPRGEERKFWSQLDSELKFDLPRLTLPDKMTKQYFLGVLAIWLVCSIFLFGKQGFLWGVAYSFGAFFAVLFLGIAILCLLAHSPLATAAPLYCGTIGELSKVVARKNYISGHSVENVWDDLCEVVSEVAGVEAKELTPETSFIKDLF